MKLGFKKNDGVVLSLGFIGINIIMSICHFIFPLQYIALFACIFLFSMPALRRVSKLMPQAIELWKRRSNTRVNLYLPTRPSASKDRKRQTSREFLKILRAIFIASSTVYSFFTTLLTSPLIEASSASIKSPVKVSSMARDFPIARVNL